MHSDLLNNSQSGLNPAVSGIGAPPEGLNLDEQPVGTVLEIQTGHHSYRLQHLGDGKVLISGHPMYCPEPIAAQVQGSIDRAGNLKWQFIGKGMKLVFMPQDHGAVRTSRIEAIRKLQSPQLVSRN